MESRSLFHGPILDGFRRWLRTATLHKSTSGAPKSSCSRPTGWARTRSCACVYRKPHPDFIRYQNRLSCAMIAFIRFVLAVLAAPFKSNSRLEAENAGLRHQLIVLRRRVRGRAQPTNNDRWFLVQMYRWFPSILKVVTIVQPETLVRGIGPAFVAIGVGNRTREEGARESR